MPRPVTLQIRSTVALAARKGMALMIGGVTHE
jgi:hypothetical protein